MSLPTPTASSAALVTGASAGLGVELARALARRGWPLVLVARREDRLKQLGADLELEHGIRAEVVAADLGEAEDRDRLLAEVAERGLDVDVLVNNAGLALSGRFQDGDVDRLRLIARVHVEAVVHLTGALLGAMVQRGRGGVLNVSSTTAFQPMAGQATYAATKAFLLSFTEGLHQDLAGTGVTATALCPGPVKTEIWDSSGATDISGSLPGFMWTEADRVAEDGIKGLAAGKRVVVPGAVNRLSALSGQHVPRFAVLRAAQRLLPTGGGHGA